jgi:hypothetical protein
MNEENVKNAVFYILERAENQKISIGKTRLIKLLYLLDIENYRSNQRVLTGLDWIFYKYGPYAFEIEKFLDKIGVIEEDVLIGGGKIFANLKKEFEEEDIKLDIETKAMIEKLIDDWGTADLNELLDYVYFETEPMFKVELRQKLDFSSVKGRRKKRKIELSRKSKEKLGELGKRIKKRLEEIEFPVEPFVKLPPEFKGKSYFWKEEVEDLSKLKGKIKVKNV